MNPKQLETRIAEPGAPALSALDILLAKEAIRDLKARYFRLMDTRDWAGWRALFTAAAVMDMRGESDALRTLGFAIPDDAAFEWRGARQITDAVSTALEGVVTVHHGHSVEIEIETAAAARGVWAMEDVIRYGPGSPIAGFHGYGHYHDLYAFEDGAWRIAGTRLTRLLVLPVPHKDGTRSVPA